jgi:predicted ferric reductase
MTTGPLQREHQLPLIALLLVGALVTWAYPNDLTLWRQVAILTGWIGAGLMLASLLFMVREPRLAAWLGGLEPMYRWHHRLGVWAYVALLVHPIALAADAWQEAPARAWAALSPWQEGWPVWLGWAALLLMMGGLAVSLSPRVPYAAWRKLHHLLSASVVLACAHLVALGIGLPLITAPLLTLFFLVWRVARADVGLAALPYVTTQVQPLASNSVEVTLRPLAQAMHAAPGQFVIVAFFGGPHFQGCGEYHPFTVSAMTPGGELSLGIKALGDCTQLLQSVTPGVAVRVQGPFGHFLSDHALHPNVWIAGGIGITPFLAVLRSAPLHQPVHLLYLHRDETDAAYVNELTALATRQPQLRLHVHACGSALPDLPALLPSADDLTGRHCYLCGPGGLVQGAVKVLQSRGVPRSAIRFEAFDFR